MKKSILLFFCAFTLGVISAQVNYTDLNPDEVLTATYATESVNIDMDGDNNPELVIYGTKKDTSAQGIPFTITGFAITTLGNTEIAGSVETLATEDIIVADSLNAGDAIDANLGYVNSSTPSIFPGVGLAASTMFGSGGNYIGVGKKYIGIKFEIGGSVHYGWIAASVTGDASECTIYDYAYEEIAGTAIAAGDMGGGFANVNASDETDFDVYVYNNILYFNGESNINLKVYNLLGEEVKQVNTDSGLNKINISNLPGGVYLVSYSFKGQTLTTKVVK